MSRGAFSQQVGTEQTAHQPFTAFCLDGPPPTKVVGRVSEAMWIFSTGLCAVVGVMVAAGVGYQLHLDRVSKRKKLEFQYQQSKRGRLPPSLMFPFGSWYTEGALGALCWATDQEPSRRELF